MVPRTLDVSQETYYSLLGVSDGSLESRMATWEHTTASWDYKIASYEYMSNSYDNKLGIFIIFVLIVIFQPNYCLRVVDSSKMRRLSKIRIMDVKYLSL